MILKFLVTGILIAVAWQLFKKRPQEKNSPKELDATMMVPCAQCGTYTEEDTEYKVKYYDEIYSFCSQNCMDSFVEKKKEESDK